MAKRVGLDTLKKRLQSKQRDDQRIVAIDMFWINQVTAWPRQDVVRTQVCLVKGKGRLWDFCPLDLKALVQVFDQLPFNDHVFDTDILLPLSP